MISGQQNINTSNLFSKHIPGYDKMKDLCSYNHDLPHCSDNISNIINTSKQIHQKQQNQKNYHNHNVNQIRKFSGMDSHQRYNNNINKKSGINTSINTQGTKLESVNTKNIKNLQEKNDFVVSGNLNSGTSNNNQFPHTFNQNTYSTFSLNHNQLKIFEFEESITTKQKKKIEIKKNLVDENKNKAQNAYYNKWKKDDSNKLSLNAKKTTIEINQNYISVTEFNKQSLEKQKLDTVEGIKAGYTENYGNLYSFNPNFYKEKLNPLNPVMLQKNPNTNFYSNTSMKNDKNMQEIDGFNMYMTDLVLSTIMTMNLNTRRPWHININKEGNKIFFDIDENSGIYYLGIPENDFAADDLEPKNVNHTENLCVESTVINQHVKEMVLAEKIELVDNEKYEFKEYPFDHKNIVKDNLEKIRTNVVGNENIESNEYELEKCMYSYREWIVADDLKVLVRCQVHAGEIVENENDEEELVKLNVYALNEYNVSVLFILKIMVFNTFLLIEI